MMVAHHSLEGTLLTACFAEAAMGVVLLNHEREVVLWNRWMEKASRLTALEATGRTLLDIFPELAGSRLLRAIGEAAELGLPAVLSHKLNPCPMPLYPPYPSSAAERPRMSQLISVSGLNVPGLPRHVMLQIQDVTNTVSRECQLRQQTQDLEQRARDLRLAQQNAQQANEAKSRFLANMSHEIRTPMNAILGLTTLALHADPNKKNRDYLEKINSSGRYLLNLINDILDFSKIEAGKLDLEETHFDLAKLLGRLAEGFSFQAAKKEIELCLVTPASLPEFLIGDPLRLEQILTNLINNALKFTPKGEVVIAVQPAAEQPAEPDKIRLLFSVQDTGIGIPPENLAKLFQPFTQADNSTTRHFGGTGLGLNISKRLVELMNGEITSQSVPNQGSTFGFTANFGRTEAGTRQSRFLNSSAVLVGASALVVDDNLTSCKILSEVLGSFGLKVAVVNSGEEALSLFADGHHFSWVIMDRRLPGMDGMLASREIIRRFRTPKGEPYVILLTPHNLRKTCEEAQEVGIDECLTKPAPATTILERMMGIIHKEPVLPDSIGASPSREVAFQGRLSGKHLLLVEDNLINQQVACELLENAGARVTVSNNGREALQQLQTITVDAVLMDVQMPEMDGYEATRLIRTLLALTDLPIIAMTANAIQGDREKCLAVGMNDYISKPVEVATLHEVLAKWLGCVPPQPAPPVRVSQTGWPSSLPGLDVNAGLSRLGEDPLFYQRIIRQFMQNHGEDACKIRQMYNDNYRLEAGKLLHTLKGLAGNLAATDLYHSAKALEIALDQGEDARIPAMLDGLDTCMAITQESSRQLLRFGLEATPEVPPVADGKIDGLLMELEECLSSFNMRANDVYHQLCTHNPRLSHQHSWLEMGEQLDKLNYAQALKMLPGLAKTLNRSLP